MYCPRCGTPNEPGDKFCSSCGATLRETKAASGTRQPLWARIERLAGKTRRARMLTGGTVLAVLVAIAAFIALRPADEGTIPRDAYTLAAERICVNGKQRIVAAERSALQTKDQGGEATLGRSLVPIVATWRAELQAMTAPSDRTDLANDLAAALRAVEIQVAKLALVADTGDRAKTLEQARRVDAETALVESAVAALGLEECARDTIGFSGPQR